MSETPLRRSDARRTEQRILALASGVLRTDPTASMSRIADTAGVHRATLYRHFPTRDDLIERLAAEATCDGRAIVAQIPDGSATLEEIRRLTRAITEFGERYGFLIGTSSVMRAGDDPIGLTSLMCRWQEASLLRGDLPPAWLAAGFTALAVMLHDATGGRPRIDKAEALYTMFVSGSGVGSDAGSQ